jgi:hypothetical protein
MAGQLIAHAKAGLSFPSDAEVRRVYLGEAYLTLAELHRAFESWSEARKGAQQAILELRPLGSGNHDSSRTKLLKEAEALLESSTGPVVDPFR